jgi:hypothetical protein
MITADLEAAKDDGIAIAALTASEGSIYGRFGFGVATFERNITVDAGPRFRLRGSMAGTVEVADPTVLLELAPQIFDRVQRATPGSIGRQEYYRLLASGSIGHDGKPDTAVRTALHYDADGTPDGYVSYRFKGWDSKPYTMEIVDLAAGTDAAYIDLWRFLGSIDLVDVLTWAEAPVDDPLAWAMEDPRCLWTPMSATCFGCASWMRRRLCQRGNMQRQASWSCGCRTTLAMPTVRGSWIPTAARRPPSAKCRTGRRTLSWTLPTWLRSTWEPYRRSRWRPRAGSGSEAPVQPSGPGRCSPWNGRRTA